MLVGDSNEEDEDVEFEDSACCMIGWNKSVKKLVD